MRASTMVFLVIAGFLTAAGIASCRSHQKAAWHYEPTRSTKGYNYFTNTAGAEILVITTKPTK